ncbi:sialoadhesin-like [Sander vitreus]
MINAASSTHRPKANLSADNGALPARGSVTLICSVNPSSSSLSSSSSWKYFWYRGDKTSEPLTSQDAVFLSTGQIRVSQEGVYRCIGGRGSPVYYTEYSDSINIHKIVTNRAVVILQPNWPEIYSGETITLRCEIQGGDTEWEYEWMTTSSYKPPNLNEYRIRSVPSYRGDYWCKGRLKRAQQNSTEWSISFTFTAPYNNRFHTHYSEPKFVWSGDVHSLASLTVSPDRVQHFTSDSVSLSCEGSSTKWRVKRFSVNGYPSYLSHCSHWGTMAGSTCYLDRQYSWLSNTVYWCESGSGEFSNAVNITANFHIILVSPVHPVTEGESVTLGCRCWTEKILSNVTFYKNDKLIQYDTRVDVKISAVSKSDEGFYRCEYSGHLSPQSWMSVKSSSSPFPVLLVAGLVSGILVIVLLPLLLLCWYTKAKGMMRDDAAVGSDYSNVNPDSTAASRGFIIQYLP